MAEGNHPFPSPIATGFERRCPRCGSGLRFDGLLDVAGRCPVCALDPGIRGAGDGPGGD